MDPLVFARNAEKFFALDSEMQINTMLTFLYVATRVSCTQKDLEVALNMTDGSTSRNVSYWAEAKKYGQAGMGFIKREEDPRDRRYKVLTLTAKGREFYETLRSSEGA